MLAWGLSSRVPLPDVPKPDAFVASLDTSQTVRDSRSEDLLPVARDRLETPESLA